MASRFVSPPVRAWAPELLILGHVTRDDYVGGPSRRLGGAAAFAARAAARLGVHTAVVTAAPRSFNLLGALRDEPNITVVRRPSRQATTFTLDYTGPVRRISLRHRARDLAATDIPVDWLTTPLCYVAPVIGECRRALVEHLHANVIVVGAQGWLRTVNDQGAVGPAVATEMLEPPRGVHALVFSEQDHPEAEALAQHAAPHVALVALTRGAAGVTLFYEATRVDIAATPAHEIDPTGAGDVFGVVLALALQRGHDAVAAATLACQAAARVVEGPGLGNLSGDLRLYPASASSTSLRTNAGSTLPL